MPGEVSSPASSATGEMFALHTKRQKARPAIADVPSCCLCQLQADGAVAIQHACLVCRAPALHRKPTSHPVTVPCISAQQRKCQASMGCCITLHQKMQGNDLVFCMYTYVMKQSGTQQGTLGDVAQLWGLIDDG